MTLAKSFLAILFFVMFGMNAAAHACREFNPDINFSKGGNHGGRCYAVAIPPSAIKPFPRDAKGRTGVYRIEEKADKLLYQYDWYEKQAVHLECGEFTGKKFEILMVRLGDSYGKKHPQAGQLGIEFYRNGKVIKSYTALELAKSPKDYWAVRCGYKLFWKSGFFRRAGRLVFEIQTGNRRIEFDPLTGSILKEVQQLPN